MGTKISGLKRTCCNQMGSVKEGTKEHEDRFDILRIAALIFCPTSAGQ